MPPTPLAKACTSAPRKPASKGEAKPTQPQPLTGRTRSRAGNQQSAAEAHEGQHQRQDKEDHAPQTAVLGEVRVAGPFRIHVREELQANQQDGLDRAGRPEAGPVELHAVVAIADEVIGPLEDAQGAKVDHNEEVQHARTRWRRPRCPS